MPSRGKGLDCEEWEKASVQCTCYSHNSWLFVCVALCEIHRLKYHKLKYGSVPPPVDTLSKSPEPGKTPCTGYNPLPGLHNSSEIVVSIILPKLPTVCIVFMVAATESDNVKICIVPLFLYYAVDTASNTSNELRPGRQLLRQ